jgi:hypothetical protein
MRTLAVTATLAATALLAVSLTLGSWQGLIAALIGLAGTAFYLYATWLLVKLLGSASAGSRISPLQALASTVAVLLKLPLIYLGWKLAQGLGPFGPTAFLLGLGLVYFVVIWRAVLTVRD